MPRTRSRSIVQAIATSLPESHAHISIESVSSQKALPRSNSVDNIKTTDYDSPTHRRRLNYPLSETETARLWAEYVALFDYSVVADSAVESSDFASSVEPYLTFQNSLLLQRQRNTELLKKMDHLLSSIEGLNRTYDLITKDTRDFQEESNRLLEEYAEITSFHKALSSDLSNLENLSSINAFLNKPGLNKIIRLSKFVDILKQLDQSLNVVRENPDFRDAESYKAVLESSLSKALTLIRNYIVSSLNKAYTTASHEIREKGSAVATALLYTRFGQVAPEINRLMLILYEKQSLYGDYEGLLGDIYNVYCSLRAKLLQGLLRDNLTGLSNSSDHKDILQILQENVAFYVRLINDEYELFCRFFNDFRLHKELQDGTIADTSLNFSESLGDADAEEYLHDPGFNYVDFMEFSLEPFFTWAESSLLEPLYDLIRDKVLRENSIETLCHMITLLQKFYDTDEEEMDDQEFNKFHINFGRLFNPILTDIQARLIFKVQVFIDDNITKYKPKLEDFSSGSTKTDSEGNATDLDAEDYYKGWYPSLKTAIVLLTQIHQLVNQAIFDDLAHNIVHICIASLKEAYEYSIKIYGPKDSQLFLMKNLLILKKNIESFDIEYSGYSDVDFDFSGITNLFEKFRSGTVWSKGVLQVARDTVPKLVTNMYDARLELLIVLRDTVHEFIETVVSEATLPLKSEVEIEVAMYDLKDSIRSVFESLRNLLAIYLNDPVVVNYLIDGVKDLIIQRYEVFYDETVSKSNQPGANKEGLNKLMELDVLIDYLSLVSEEIFGELWDEDEDLSVGMVNDVSDIEPIEDDYEYTRSD